MSANKLKLNDAKTEIIVFSSKSNSHFIKEQNLAVTIGSSIIQPSLSVRNLGAYLDSTLSMETQVANTVKSGYYHLCRIAKIRCHLTQSACARAVIATVISRLDYHNGLLSGISERLLRRLQVLQNNAARLVTQTPRRAHITPVLFDLHWLPVRHRISYKLLLIIHKTLHSSHSPSYLKDLLCNYAPSRTLRSQNCVLLTEQRTNKTIGERTFQYHAPKLWNSIPQSLRETTQIEKFKRDLKTYLFKQSF